MRIKKLLFIRRLKKYLCSFALMIKAYVCIGGNIIINRFMI